MRRQIVKKITIFYADDLVDAAWRYQDQYKNYDILINQDDFTKLKVSSRIEWVESSVKDLLSQQLNVAVITNDYSLIMLIENITPSEQFEIYHVDENKYFNSFIELTPNPTLGVSEYLYKTAVQKALAGG